MARSGSKSAGAPLSYPADNRCASIAISKPFSEMSLGMVCSLHLRTLRGRFVANVNLSCNRGRDEGGAVFVEPHASGVHALDHPINATAKLPQSSCHLFLFLQRRHGKHEVYRVTDIELLLCCAVR